MGIVARVELYHVSIPLPAPFYPSWIPGLPQAENRFTLIKVITDDGVIGYSAGTAMGRERAGLGEILGPYLIGEEATDIPLIQQRVREMGYLGWHNAWIEPAFWDIKGKYAGKPVWEMLGGSPCTVQLYASTGELKTPERRIEELEQRYDEGFRAAKLRVHAFDEQEDIRHVTETARVLGGKMRLGVDANQAWRVTIIADAPLWDLPRAKRFAEACADAGLGWLEEPLPMDAYEDLATLTALSRVPIAGGELHSAGLPELKMMIERKCYSIFQPDATFTGGIAQSFEIAALCRQHGLAYTPHTWTNGIGFAINLHLFAASGFADTGLLEYPYNPPGWTVEGRDGLLQKPFQHQQGKISPPDGPGLGIDIDHAALRKYGRRFFVMDKVRLAWYSIRTRGIALSREINRIKKAKKQASSTTG